MQDLPTTANPTIPSSLRSDLAPAEAATSALQTPASVPSAVAGPLEDEPQLTRSRRDPLAWKFAEAERLTALGDEARCLYRSLSVLRARLARDVRRPAYLVYTNRQMLALAEQRPGDDAGLKSCGLGAQRIREYGAELLGVLKSR